LVQGWAELRTEGLLSAVKALYFPIQGGYLTLSQVITEGTVIGTLTLAGEKIYVLISTGEIPGDAE
jgi:hypothetical protein